MIAVPITLFWIAVIAGGIYLIYCIGLIMRWWDGC